MTFQSPLSSAFSHCLKLPAAVSLAAGILVMSAAAQTAQSQQAGTPFSVEVDPQSIQTVASDPVSTLRVSARRVVLDITVTGANGQPVTGLTQADFRVTEDGQPQDLRSFELHTVEAQPTLAAPKLPPNTFSNLSAAPSGGPVTVILYDLLNTPLDAQAYGHEQLLAFLRQRKTSGQVAIFVLTDKLHMLQGFTDDDDRLIAALSIAKAKGYKPSLVQTQAEATQQSDMLTQTDGNQNGADARRDVSFQTIAGMLKNIEAQEASYDLDRRIDDTALALEQIARFLIALPGRKNLLWMSAAFPSGVLPSSGVDARDPVSGQLAFSSARNDTGEIVKATDELNLSHVAIYPIDIRGLMVNPMYSAAANIAFEPGQGKDARAVHDFHQTLSAEHSTMDEIADETGGRAFYNTNGLKEAAADALQEGSVYYTVSYTPTNKVYDGRLRKIRVQLTTPGYQLHYRHSYFGDGLDDLARASQENPSDSLAISLEHGAPAAHDLFFEAHVAPQGAPIPATPEQMAELAHYEAGETRKKGKASPEPQSPMMMQPYVVNYGLLPRQLDLRRGPDDNLRGSLEFAALSYNDDGLTLYGTRLKIQDVIRPERYAFMLDGGYHMVQAILVPVSARWLRLAVRDTYTNRIGSMEIALPLAREANSDAQPTATPKPAGPPAP